jgi:hypothetical protein
MENESPEILEKIKRKREIVKQWRKNNPDKVSVMAKNWRLRNPDYYPTHHKEYVKSNRDKIKEISKRYYESHKDKIIKSNKLRKESNKEKNREYMRGYNKKWRLNNPDKVREMVQRSNEKRKVNPKIKFHHRISAGVNRSLKGNKNGYAWESLVGYSCDKLREHLEKHFLSGMTWDNMNEWHVDHIVPVGAFNFQTYNDIDFKKCWALSNLQPLWKIDNLKKSNHLKHPHQPSLAL